MRLSIELSGSLALYSNAPFEEWPDQWHVPHPTGITRSNPTFLGFRLLAFKFDAKGNLSMMLRTDLSHAKVKSLDEVDFGGGAGIAVLQQDSSCPHTLGTGDVAAYCTQQEGGQ